jgi:LytS/YehU family sensor histidine kinase
MRYILYECNEGKVPLKKEINYLKNYIELEKLRLSKSFDIKVNVEGDTDGKFISPLLLTPFLENAFKHGINQQLLDGYIHVTLIVNQENLQLTIENSKGSSGPTENPQKKSGGIGLANVERRLEILYPATHTLNTENKIDHYLIELTLKLDT